MTASDLRGVYERFMAALVRLDSAELEKLIHSDFEEFFPQSGEVTRGLENVKAIIENYPGKIEDLGGQHFVGAQDRWVSTPSLTLLRIEGTGDTFTGVQKARYPDGSEWHVVQIAQMRDQRVWRLETFFAPAFEAPAWRSQWVTLRRRRA